ncbi:acetolactate synthase small subunit [Paenibacillus sp.]|uniref:acetolactate synthase small subunit n=1 Tax=Paenibacillus sp. TaxID=58172 RepID=UPI002D704B8F|nr:acetolactate synthase small subunit [Paenibacillus sp.]HZG88412.1 acetolactate synthase small subunit [Paenibacillus sp.]
MKNRKTLSLLVADHPGVLQRVAGLFGRRGFNIDSIAVGECEQPGCARMTIVTPDEGRGVDQIVRQLEKLVDVYEVRVLDRPAVSRQYMLVRVRLAPGEERAQRLRKWSESFPCEVLDVRDDAVALQLVASRAQNRALLRLIAAEADVEQVACAGEVALPL